MLTSAQTLTAVPGLTYRMLDHWIACGYLPCVQPGTGSGFPREIPDAAVAKLRLMVELTTGLGVRASTASPVADELLTTGFVQTGALTLTTERP